MLNLDKTGIDKLLVQLEDKQFFGNRYRLYKEKAEPVLLGKGTFSYVYEMYDYKNNEENRKKLTENPSTSDINIQRAAADSIKIKVQSTNGLGAQETGIYQLFLSTWCNPVDGAKCKEFIDNTQALGLKMGSALLADNKSRNCKRGDYVELDSEPTFKTSPDADIGNINRAIKEHWENLGL